LCNSAGYQRASLSHAVIVAKNQGLVSPTESS